MGENLQIIVLSNRSEGILFAHIIESVTEGMASYARMLDLWLPDYKVIRDLGFNDDEIALIVRVLRDNEAEVKHHADSGEPLFIEALPDGIKELRKAGSP